MREDPRYSHRRLRPCAIPIHEYKGRRAVSSTFRYEYLMDTTTCTRFTYMRQWPLMQMQATTSGRRQAGIATPLRMKSARLSTEPSPSSIPALTLKSLNRTDDGYIGLHAFTPAASMVGCPPLRSVRGNEYHRQGNSADTGNWTGLDWTGPWKGLVPVDTSSCSLGHYVIEGVDRVAS